MQPGDYATVIDDGSLVQYIDMEDEGFGLFAVVSMVDSDRESGETFVLDETKVRCLPDVIDVAVR